MASDAHRALAEPAGGLSQHLPCLSRLAGLRRAGVLCEVMNPGGTMMRGAQVAAYADAQGLPVLTIDDLVACTSAPVPVC